MTQAVLKNEITDLHPNSDLESDQLKEVGEAVANTVADAFRILVNTQGLHWNAEGPLFFALHKLTEDQYQEQFKAIDVLAERVRALGLPAPQSLREFDERSVIRDVPEDGNLESRIARLISDYEVAVRRLKLVAELAETNGDIKTADLLTSRIGVYEQNAWMLRATIATS